MAFLFIVEFLAYLCYQSLKIQQPLLSIFGVQALVSHTIVTKGFDVGGVQHRQRWTPAQAEYVVR